MMNLTLKLTNTTRLTELTKLHWFSNRRHRHCQTFIHLFSTSPLTVAELFLKSEWYSAEQIHLFVFGTLFNFVTVCYCFLFPFHVISPSQTNAKRNNNWCTTLVMFTVLQATKYLQKKKCSSVPNLCLFPEPNNLLCSAK